MELAVADIYARGLYGAAQDAGKTDEIREELVQLEDIFRDTKMFCRFLQDPAISRVEKKQKIDRIFSGRISKETRNFLCLLVDKGRVSLFHIIVRRYVALDDEEHHVAEGIIESAVPLTDDQIERFDRQVSGFYGKSIRLQNVVNRSLIGGVKIYAEDRLIDASLSTKLEKLEDRIQRG